MPVCLSAGIISGRSDSDDQWGTLFIPSGISAGLRRKGVGAGAAAAVGNEAPACLNCG